VGRVSEAPGAEHTTESKRKALGSLNTAQQPGGGGGVSWKPLDGSVVAGEVLQQLLSTLPG